MSLLSAIQPLDLNVAATRLWEQQIEDMPGVDRLNLSNYDVLKSYLEQYADSDSYLTSPTYFLFTGRKGLWSYSHDGYKVLFCWHPNCEGQILIFPPLDANALNLVAELLLVLPHPPLGIRLARVKAGFAQDNIIQHLEAVSERSIDCISLREEILDWHYPIRILSTSHVKAAKGNKFRNVRKGLIHAKQHNIEKRPLNLTIHREDVGKLLHRWASLVSKTKEEYADLYETYNSLFLLSLDQTHSVEGLVYYVNDKLEAISLWDISMGKVMTANLYANFCNTTLDGLAEYTIVSVCGALQDKGIDLLNMGGSETETLDFFKNKFRPAVSIELCSIDVKLDEENTSHTEIRAKYA